jgi:virginiamycin A acetyltransferase
MSTPNHGKLMSTPDRDAFRDAERFEVECMLYACDPKRLSLGKLCSIAAGWRFVVTGTNHFSAEPSDLPGTHSSGRKQDQTAVRWRAGTNPWG